MLKLGRRKLKKTHSKINESIRRGCSYFVNHHDVFTLVIGFLLKRKQTVISEFHVFTHGINCIFYCSWKW